MDTGVSAFDFIYLPRKKGVGDDDAERAPQERTPAPAKEKPSEQEGELPPAASPRPSFG
jgi:hypothetical protein